MHRGDGLTRRLISLVFNALFRLLFPGLRVRDVNAKPKIMTRAAYERLELESDDWFIDAEIMIQARRLGLRIGEVETDFLALTGRRSFINLRTLLEFLANLTRYRLREIRRRSTKERVRTLVTGASGKLGGRLLPRLARLGVAGRVLHRRAAVEVPAGWESVRADLTEPSSLAGACDGCDGILHLAALTHSNDASRYERVNAGGTRNLLAAARQAGVGRFVHVSTRAIGAGGGAYSRSKIHAEAAVRDSGIPWTILRPAEVYGAGEGGEGLAALIERARHGRWVPVVGDGSYRLAPVFVDDVVDGLCAAVRAPAAGRLFHLAGPEEMTYLQLIERLAAYFGTRPRRVRVPAAALHGAALLLALLPLEHPPLVADQVPRLLSPKPYEIAAAAAELGFEPRRIEEGLGRRRRRASRRLRGEPGEAANVGREEAAAEPDRSARATSTGAGRS